MKVKKVLFALVASTTLLFASCEPNTSAKGDKIYEDDVKIDAVN